MESWILTVGCPSEQFGDCQKEWLKYNILMRAVQTMEDAIIELSRSNYLLLSICAKAHNYLPYLRLIRDMKSIPILIASSDYNAAEKIEAIESGADIYMELPLTVEECVATGWALVRRYTELNTKKQEHVSIISNKDIFICLDYRKVFVHSVEINLTRMEFDILQLLMSNKRRVFTYEQIFCHVWGNEYYDNQNSVLWNHIKRLRQKLRIDPDMPEYIKNVHEIGYAFDPE